MLGPESSYTRSLTDLFLTIGVLDNKDLGVGDRIRVVRVRVFRVRVEVKGKK
jgi:hypothetical protein